MHLSSERRGRCFVIKSAGFSVPRTFRSSSCLVPCISCIHRQLILMCLNFPAPLRFAIASAADESPYTTPPFSTPKSLIMLRAPSGSAEHLTSATSSASAELVVTYFCIRAQPLRKWLPIIKAAPHSWTSRLPYTRPDLNPSSQQSLARCLASRIFKRCDHSQANICPTA